MSDKSFPALVNAIISQRLEAMWTAIPAVVTKTNLTTMKCDVMPKMKLENPQTEELEELPIILDVPVAFQKTAGSVLIMPPEVGDVVLVLFSKYALDNLLKDVQTADHDDVRRFDIGDALIIAGLHISTDTIPAMGTGDILLQHKSGAYLKFDSAGNLTIYAKTINLNEMP